MALSEATNLGAFTDKYLGRDKKNLFGIHGALQQTELNTNAAASLAYKTGKTIGRTPGQVSSGQTMKSFKRMFGLSTDGGKRTRKYLRNKKSKTHKVGGKRRHRRGKSSRAGNKTKMTRKSN